MIIQQTTTLIFQYPQDYMQEQEWCKTKDDRWIHKGTDTLGAVYENQISYSIGSSVSVKTEPRKDEPTISRMEQVEEPQIYGNEHNCIMTLFGDCSYAETGCGDCEVVEKVRKALDKYEPKDEPHGRLIDADAMKESMKSPENNPELAEVLTRWIDARPTVKEGSE